MDRKIKLGAILLLVLNIALFFHLFVVYWDLPILNINPVDESNQPSMQLTYPPVEDGTPFYYSENYTVRGLVCTIHLYLNYSGTLAEGVPIKVYAVGVRYTDGSQITGIVLRFSGASKYTEGGDKVISTGSPIFNPPLVNSSNLITHSDYDYYGVLDALGLTLDGITIPQSQIYRMLRPALPIGTIAYDVEGDYYPSLQINFENGSSVTAEYPYLNRRVHVIGADVVQQQKESRKSNAIAFDGILLSVLNISALGSFIVNKFNKKKIPADSNKPQPQNEQADQQVQGDKVESKEQREEASNPQNENAKK